MIVRVLSFLETAPLPRHSGQGESCYRKTRSRTVDTKGERRRWDELIYTTDRYILFDRSVYI